MFIEATAYQCFTYKTERGLVSQQFLERTKNDEDIGRKLSLETKQGVTKAADSSAPENMGGYSRLWK